ncbi:MAG: redox-regulated ATPase YchF, partial [Rhodomicrobium sp.]|nr:redox-regulated ATPase YchF [Rhodomicrobium sp.]
IADAETVETELMLADLESLERRRATTEKKAKGQDKEAKTALGLIDIALKYVSEGKPARLALAEIPESEHRAFRQLQLLTSKPALYVCNVDEASAASGNAYSKQVQDRFGGEGAEVVVISAKIEAELAQLDEEERKLYLAELGLQEPGLNRLIAAGYRLLGLITYFTAGPKETRAWTITKGTTAPGAAGVIHSDFEKGFIRAETIAYNDFVTLGGEAGAKEAGKMRLEGKDYTVHDGDVMHFRFAN